MISQYDEIQQKVKLHEAVLKGKVKSTQNLQSLGMKVILQKNKKITLSKKQLQDKVIKARKLKIKINEIYSNHFASIFNTKTTSHSSLLQIKTQRKLVNHHQNKDINRFSPSKRMFLSAQNHQKIKSLVKGKPKYVEDGEGKMNLYDNFTDQQLNQIEEDQNYYLKNQEMITVFRKYMVRKRSNNKDFSYEKFSIKNNSDQIYSFSQKSNADKRSYILNTLGITKNTTNQNKSVLHLLTNPIDFSNTMPDIRSKSVPLRNSKKQLFTIFKDKQIMNKDKIIQQHYKKILDLRIDRNYYDGMATEKRAVHRQNIHKIITNKNKQDTQRSIIYRQRNKTVFDQIGKTIEMAQTIRVEMMKRRENNKKI